MCDSWEEGDDYAEGYAVGEENKGVGSRVVALLFWLLVGEYHVLCCV